MGIFSKRQTEKITKESKSSRDLFIIWLKKHEQYDDDEIKNTIYYINIIVSSFCNSNTNLYGFQDGKEFSSFIRQLQNNLLFQRMNNRANNAYNVALKKLYEFYLSFEQSSNPKLPKIDTNSQSISEKAQSKNNTNIVSNNNSKAENKIIQELQHNLFKSREETAMLRREYEQKLSTLISDNDEQYEQITELKSIIEKYTTLATKQKQTINTLDAEIIEAKKQISVQSLLDSRDQQCEQLKTELEDLKVKYSEHSIQKSRLQESNIKLTDMYAELENESQYLQDENTTLTDRVDKQDELINQLKKELATEKEKQNNYNDLQDKYQKLKKRFDDQEAHTRSQNKRIALLEKELQDEKSKFGLSEKTISPVLNENNNDVSQSATVPKNTVDLENQDCNSKTENYIESLLKEEKYLPLINELKKAKITTIADLSNTNLVLFCNEHDIYDYKTRIKIIKEVKGILQSKYETTTKDTTIKQTNSSSERPSVSSTTVITAPKNATESEKLINSKDTEIQDKNIPNNVAVKADDQITSDQPILNAIKIGEKTIRVDGWSDVLYYVCSSLFRSNMKIMFQCVDKKLPLGRPFTLLTSRNTYSTARLLPNGIYINPVARINTIKTACYYLCDICHYSHDYIQFFGKNTDSSYQRQIKTSYEKQSSNNLIYERTAQPTAQTRAVLQALKESGVKPITPQNLAKQINIYSSIVESLLSQNDQCFEIMRKQYVHIDSIVDWELASDIMLRTLETQFARNYGYSNKSLLYHSLSHDDNFAMFLNDNNMDDEEKVFFMALYLFNKTKFKNNSFCFYNNFHIWQKEPDYPKSNKGILIHYCKEQGGYMRREDAEDYLERLAINVQFTGLINLKYDDIFLLYDKNEYLYNDASFFTPAWLDHFQEKCQVLFNESPVIIIRDLDQSFFSILPTLPRGLSWNRIIFQDVIDNFKRIPYRLIPTIEGQRSDTLNAAVVHKNANITCNADVLLYLLSKSNDANRDFSADELRALLIKNKLIDPNQLTQNAQLKRNFTKNGYTWKSTGKVFIRCE